MMDGRAAPLLFATLGMLVASCATVPPPAVPMVTNAYVVVGPDGQAVARAIVAATTCPAIDVDGVAQPMTMRAPAQRIPQRKDQAKASDFPVAVCEYALPARAQRVALAGVALPLPKPTPSRIVVLGDTGCRLYASAFGSVFQRCDDTTQWPFARVAAAAAAPARRSRRSRHRNHSPRDCPRSLATRVGTGSRDSGSRRCG